MKLSLCALIFTLNFFAPQTPVQTPVNCVLVNLSPLRLACDDKDKTELVIPASDWPEIWHSQHLTGTYNAELRDGQLFAVETLEESGRTERIRANTLKEQRRWRRPAMQQPIEP